VLLAVGNINDVLHKPPQEEVTWCEIRRPGGPCQQSHIVITKTPNPAMWQFIVEEATNNVVLVGWCPVLLEDESPGVSSQLWEQPQLQHIQVDATCHNLLTEEKRPI
jgi:hypothetical protein